MAFELVVLTPHDDQARRWAGRLARDFSEVSVVVPEDEAGTIRALGAGAPAAFGTLPAHLLAHARGLRWLQAPMAAPPEGYYYPELARHPVVVTNLRDTYTDHVATHAVALLLALARNLHRYARFQVEHRWQKIGEDDSVLHLQRATVLVVGLGALGTEISRLLQPLGCRVVGTDARRTDKPETVSEMGPPERLDEFLASADAVVVTVPHTPETDRLMDAGRLALLKPSAVLVNIGRGKVVDIDAVAQALASGRLRGAAFDVFPTEPLDAGHPLWDEPRAIVTPHAAAVGPFADERRYAVLLENARRFAAGDPLLNVVDKARWF